MKRTGVMFSFGLLIAMTSSLSMRADTPASQPAFELEQSKPEPPVTGHLGTKGYQPTKDEAPFLKDVVTDTDVSILTDKAPAIAGHAGKNVAWFGIIREISEDKAKNETRVLVEMKYFDGLTELDLQLVSIDGAGDFVAILPGTGHKLEPLALLRVCGTVLADEKGIPQVQAKYCRQWSWGLFTFMDYGPDASNPKWVALRKVTGDDVYSHRVDNAFYEKRLGPKPKVD